MTLTKYAGVTCPSLSTTGAYVFPGYTFLVWVLINGTGSVTGVSIPGVTGITFSRVGFVTASTYRLEAWASTVVASQFAPASISATVTTTGSITATCNTVQVYTNVDSFRATTSTNTGTTSAWSLTDIATTVQNQGLAFGIAQNIGTGGIPAASIVTPAQVYASGANANTIHDAGNTLTLSSNYGSTDGVGIIPSITGTLSPAPTQWLSLGVAVFGKTVTMDDTQPCYMVGENGILLGTPDGQPLPIYDVDSITGLQNLTVTSSTQPFDGADGSTVQAKYLAGDTIVINGHLVTNPPVAQSIIDNMKTSAKPTPKINGIPFFWKYSSILPRRLQVKPIGFQMDDDRNRTLGNIPFQYQLQAVDARAYGMLVSGSQNTPSSGSTYTAVITTSGNTDTFPIIYFTNWGTPRDPTGTNLGWYFSNITWDQAYPAASAQPASVAVGNSVAGVGTLPVGAYKLDLANLSLTQVSSGTDYSAFIITRRWFGLVGNMTNYVTMQRPTGSTVTNEGFSWVYGDAWV